MRIFTTSQQENFPEKGFHIVNCGYDKSISKFVWKLSRTRQDYYLVTVTQGMVEYWLDETSIKLNEGDFFLYFPGDKQKFVFDTYTHTTTHWVHFVGDEADELIQKLQLFHGKINVKTETPKKLLLRLINESILQNPHYEVIAKGLLFELLATLAREDFESKRKSDVVKHNHDAFLQVIEKMTKNPQISNEECAKDCFLSVSQFIRVFKKKFNTTPHQYKLNILINLAKDLLINSDLSLTEIAKNLGFDSETLYFNSLFKKQTGMSPTEFRNKNKCEPDAQAVSIPYDQSSLIHMEKE
jgi:AraC-like DNA-binding protein